MTISAVSEALDWLAQVKSYSDMKVKPILLSEINNWQVEPDRISHETGRFFSIRGLIGEVNGQKVEQPIIDQPEIGILGFLVKDINGETFVYVQAKAEPGNVGDVHIAPTVQATESNYMQVHQGEPTFLLNYFKSLHPSVHICSDLLQSEQGTRFLNKYNRNMVVCVPKDEPILDRQNWAWIRLDVLFQLLGHDYAVNTDARSVLVSTNWHDILSQSGMLSSTTRLNHQLIETYKGLRSKDAFKGQPFNRIQKKRSQVSHNQQLVPLKALSGWHYSDQMITHESGGEFKVIGVDVKVNGREVPHWQQPLVQSVETLNCTLVYENDQNQHHFYLRFSHEIGFANHIQYGPTLQYEHVEQCNDAEKQMMDIVNNSGRLVSQYYQSDEGGRFYFSKAKYQLIEIPRQDHPQLETSFCKVSMDELFELLFTTGYTTNELRSAMSLLLVQLVNAV